MAMRERYLYVCVNRREDGAPKGSCAARGAEGVHAALKEGLKVRGLAEERARALTCSCLDVCWEGPVVVVEPDHHFYGRVQAEDVPELLASLQTGEPVTRLLLEREDFVEPRLRPQRD